jgi:UDP-3-O-[3-hydroxymyristoyl] N-acetylglucosamine deacetylase
LHLQNTLNSPIEFEGVGLHTGEFAHLRICPAPPNTGIVFCRTDLDFFRIEATAKNVAKVSYATTLMKQGVMLSTVEHLLSALMATEIDNALLEIDNLEVPILDGSAQPFVDKILRSGLHRFHEPRKYLQIQKPVHIKHQDKKISIFPSDQFLVEYSIDFKHPLIGKQLLEFYPDRDSYAMDIAPARTFGFFKEVEELRKNGLIRGGSLKNAVVLTETGIINGPLRFFDEFVRHKVLDCLGDLSLVGHPILGRVVANRAGHAMHTELASKIMAEKSSWKLIIRSPKPEFQTDLSSMAIPA